MTHNTHKKLQGPLFGSPAIKTAAVAAVALFIFSCGSDKKTELETDGPKVLTEGIYISPDMPVDIFTNGDSASKATLTEAAFFAWKEFIALNWPAKYGQRDTPDTTMRFGDNPLDTALVWHTFRHKVEIFPGNGQPPHGFNQGGPDYGYNDGPAYFYNPNSTKTSDGQVLPLTGVPSVKTPWINLDEVNEIGVANMFAGVEDTTDHGNMMIYLAKGNKQEYVYAARNNWYAGGTNFQTAQSKTTNYINANSNTPPPYMGDSLVSFPYGTIEVKTAWRKLSTAEQQSNRFYSNKVRHYVSKKDTLRYVDEVYGMVALHIIHKTPTAPYFIFATFEQADNLLTTTGQRVEDENGTMLQNADSNAFSPNYKVTNAVGSAPMKFSPTTANAIPGKSLYYKNIPSTNFNTGGLLPDSLQPPLGTTRINRRLYPISQDIINVNQAAHASITNYNPNAVWQYYKLISVQYKPISKPTPGVDYHGNDSATYYQSNAVVESDYILQRFSGRFYSAVLGGKTVVANLITDFQATAGNPPVTNAYNNGKFLMGGCMGCHGNATNGGSDYSFILGQPVDSPSPTRQITSAEATLKMVEKFNAGIAHQKPKKKK